MTRFRYRAATSAGDVIEGEMEAGARAMVVERLRGDGHVPIRVDEIAGEIVGRIAFLSSGGRDRLSTAEVALVTRELATLLKAGLQLDRALAMLAEIAERKAVRTFLSRTLEAVRGGSTFTQALEPYRSRLPALYPGMVSAGEAGGALDEVMGRLADTLERAAALKDTVRSALYYPALVLVVAVASIVLLLTVVVPEFAPLFADSGAALPTSTRIIIALGEIMREAWWALLALMLLPPAALALHNQRPEGRIRWDRFKLRLPLVGPVLQRTDVARFCRTLGTLLSNGVPVLNALRIAGDSVANQAIAEAVHALGQRLKRGDSLAQPLAESDLFPALAVQLIRVGEESGQLQAMLARVADIYDEEVKRALQRMVSLLVPGLTVALGLVVAGIVASMLTAIVGAYDLAL
jgi:general secretion pathway protein F